MKLLEGDRAITKRDLLDRIAKMQKAISRLDLRAQTAEKECDRLRAELIRLRAEA